MKKIIILIGFILNNYIGDDIKAHKSESPMNQSPIEPSLQHETSEKNLLIIGGSFGALVFLVILGYGLYKLKNNIKNDKFYKGLTEKINILFSENEKNKGRYSLLEKPMNVIEILNNSFVVRIEKFKNITLSIKKNSIGLECKNCNDINDLQSLKDNVTQIKTSEKNQYILRLIEFTIENLTKKDKITPEIESVQFKNFPLEYINITAQMNQEELKTAYQLLYIGADLIKNSQSKELWKKQEVPKSEEEE